MNNEKTKGQLKDWMTEYFNKINHKFQINPNNQISKIMIREKYLIINFEYCNPPKTDNPFNSKIKKAPPKPEELF